MHAETFDVAWLTGVDVNAFLLRECGRVSAGSVKGRVAELRALFRFLYVQGLIPLQLGGALPPVGGWRLAKIPRLIGGKEVQAAIDSCDTGTVAGARDRAIMLLVARLGLRSVEVARLELDDLDWRHGVLTVRGKGHREDLMPLPTEVGQAVSDYLARRGRLEGSRRAFFTNQAPRVPIRPGLGNELGRTELQTRQDHAVWTAPDASRTSWRAAASGDRPGRDQPSTPSPRPGHHRRIREGRPGQPAPPGAAVAGGALMSTLTIALDDYLALRHGLGHQMADAARCLPSFVTLLESQGLSTVTVQAALDWCQQPAPVGGVTVVPQRMIAARGFARYLSGIDPATQVPPIGLVPWHPQRPEPFIYSQTDIAAMLIAARQLGPGPLRGLT